MDAEYCAPTVPLGRELVLITGSLLTVIGSGCGPTVTPAPSVTATLKFDVTGADGDPEIVPVAPDDVNVRPEGNVPLGFQV